MMGSRTRNILASIAVLGLCPVAFAKPPAIAGYERAAGIAGRLQTARRRLQQEEEFKKFPRMKKILISMKQGKSEFEGLELSGPKVLREVLKKWKGIQKDDENAVTKEDLEILALLPEAMKRRYPRGPKMTNKDERYKASKALVAALMDERLHVRRIAIKALTEIYDCSARLYQPEQDKRDRKQRKDDWDKFIKRERK